MNDLYLISAGVVELSKPAEPLSPDEDKDKKEDEKKNDEPEKKVEDYISHGSHYHNCYDGHASRYDSHYLVNVTAITLTVCITIR